jgi:hypothetical protein
MTDTSTLENNEYSKEERLELVNYFNSSEFGDKYIATMRVTILTRADQVIIKLLPGINIDALASYALETFRDGINKMNNDINKRCHH